MDLKSVMNEILSENIKDEYDVALLFSGGTDSLTCLFSLLDMNIRPKLYTFHLEGVIHKDLEISKFVADYYGLDLKVVEIKKDISQLKEDVTFLTQQLNLKLKTNVQCSYPFLKMSKHIKEGTVISGLCADDLYGSSKSMSIKCSNDKKLFDDMRAKKHSNELSSAYKPIKMIIEELNNKKFIAPYKTDTMFNYFIDKSWRELNSPKQKQVAVDAYFTYFKELNVYRRNCNLQVGSMIREWHNELLSTDLNRLKRSRVDEIYKDLNKEVYS